MDHDIQFAGQVVEHHHFIRHHQENIRAADLVRLGAGSEHRLDGAHGVVAEITDQAAGEAWQVGDDRHLVALAKGAHVVERIGRGLALDDLAVVFEAHLVAEDAQDHAARQPNDRIAPPFLATLYRLEQIRVRPVGELEISA